MYNFRTEKPEAGDYLHVETHLSYTVSSKPAERWLDHLRKKEGKNTYKKYRYRPSNHSARRKKNP